ncbi:membrane-associated protease RseP (regulator of RpoE activity) [Trueperella bonasi]|uniref:Membrane-associated protease RseP (Regulator of RpoE activity) n=1 Tax=Trueperella bonasi TaxID=312286 RepID=A0ABT9NHT3_9ACTO|nr:site-2 protease family protein [Trueperella bonasi]MDP9806956.1 membrane-associated protease RseP (regulator of RpoE activity) [Trueperella bonasi]
MGALPGIIFLIVGLLVSVGIHELGHLIPAKRFGVKVSQYFIGFGPTLWSTMRGGTEYGLKAIPLGGYVQMAGMLAPAKPGTRTYKNGQLTLAEEARRASAEDLSPGEEDRAFWRLPARQKLVVMFAGPVTNLILAGLLIGLVVSGFGLPALTNQVGAITPCVGQAQQCSTEHPPSPAADSALEVGDTVVAWGHTSTSNWEELSAAIANGGTGPVTVRIEREGEPIDVVVHPVLVERPVVENGQVVVDDAGEPHTHTVPYAGISPTSQRERQSVWQVPGYVWDFTIATGKVLVSLPMNLWNTAADLVTGAERDPTGVVGIVGVADIAGNISSSQGEGYGAVDRLGDLTLLLAGLNMSLFMFNMLPLLPLDGGHILGALIEGTRRKIAKVQGKPDPGPFDTARLLPLSYVVLAALIAMTVLLVVADILNPVV